MVNVNSKRHEMVYPFKRQVYSFDCGAACMETVLTYFGYDAREDEILKIANTDRNGTLIEGLIRVAGKYGLKYKACENMKIDDLRKCIDKGHPCITPIQAWGPETKSKKWEKVWAYGHYVVPIGYDEQNFYFEDPASYCRTYLTFEEMDRRWHDKDTQGRKLVHFGLIFGGRPERFDDSEVVHME
jgi:predicted double-glycine peptidase